MNVRTISALVAVAALAAAAGYFVRGDLGRGAAGPAPEAAAEPRVPNQLKFADGAPQ